MAYPPYTPGSLAEQVARAKEHFRDYLDQKLADFEQRRIRRHELGLKVVNFVGHGRCGKDASAAAFAEVTHARYGGATSTVVNPMIAWCLGLNEQRSFETRHDNRMYWYDWCCEFRREDPSLLPKILLGIGDIVVGTRSLTELLAAASQVVDCTVWINRLESPVDPTMEYDAYDVLQLPKWDWIDNNKDLAALHNSVKRVARSLNMLCV